MPDSEGKRFDRPGVGLWKWMLITAIIISFVVFFDLFAEYRIQTNKSAADFTNHTE